MANGDPFDVDTLYPGYTNRLFQLESNSGRDPRSMDPDARNRGLGQFGREEERKYGITDWRDPAQQRRGVNLEAAEHYNLLSRSLGRPPTAAEMYLTHQQGPGGGPALLAADPSQPAWMAVRSKYPSSDIALQAIHDNVLQDSPLYHTPTQNISTGDFRNMWLTKWNGGSGTWAGGPQTQPSIGAGDTEAAAATSAQTGAGSSNPLANMAMNALKQQPLQPAPAMNLLSGPRGNPYLQQLLAAMQQQNPQA